MPRTLVTNDDGVASPGLRVLAGAARHAGLDVTVVAPAFDASGTSAAMNAAAPDGNVVVEPVPEPTDAAETGTQGIDVYAVQGPPAFIVRAAMFGAFGPPPDLVLSGINRGLNTGRAILHSGTVGAALTAAAYGCRALALSADIEDDESWDPDCPAVSAALGWLVRSPQSTMLNVNVPKAAHSGRIDARATRLAGLGTVQAQMSERGGGLVPVTFAGFEEEPEEGTDEAALAAGFVSVTAIRGLTDDARFDLGRIVGG